VLIVLFLSLKRGGVVSFAMALIVYLQVNTFIQKGQLRLKELFIVIFVGLPLFFIITEIFQDYVSELFYRLGNVQADEGSGRTTVYEDTWNMIKKSNFQSLLLGHGWNMVKEKSITGFSAHNDFLELLYDSGIFVTGIYLSFIYKIYKRMFKLIRHRSPNAAPFSFSVITFTVNSMISHVVLYPYYFIPVAVVWGYIIGKENRDNKLIRIKK
jgi:O-antigen ligase